jgi:hypothetical protein
MTLWLIAEHVGDLGVSEVVELMDGYKRSCAVLSDHPRAAAGRRNGLLPPVL